MFTEISIFSFGVVHVDNENSMDANDGDGRSANISVHVELWLQDESDTNDFNAANNSSSQLTASGIIVGFSWRLARPFVVGAEPVRMPFGAH